MLNPDEKGADMNLSVALAERADKPVLRTLLAACLEEFAAFAPPAGDYIYFDAYWQVDAGRWPYVIRRSDNPAGFAFVRAPCELRAEFSMAEFYIIPSERRRGAGSTAAGQVLIRHPGQWGLDILRTNTAALRFCPAALAAAGVHGLRRSKAGKCIRYQFEVRS